MLLFPPALSFLFFASREMEKCILASTSLLLLQLCIIFTLFTIFTVLYISDILTFGGNEQT